MQNLEKIELTFTEKLFISQLIPTEDSFNNLVVRNDIVEKIGLKQEDYTENKYKVVGKNSTWSDTGKKTIVEFTNPEKEYLKEKLKLADTQKKLNFRLVDFYKKII